MNSWNKLPLLVRFEILEQLATSALGHQDNAKALQLANDAGAILATAKWIPEDQIALSARLAALRLRAGDRAKARSDADAALALYEKQRTSIVDIYRAKALRPLAEVYQGLGERVAAQALFAQAIEAGVANPNSRPRAEDLSATCTSMAKCGFEPDQALLARMLQIRAMLGQPW